jgi:hypothetical protein
MLGLIIQFHSFVGEGDTRFSGAGCRLWPVLGRPAGLPGWVRAA